MLSRLCVSLLSLTIAVAIGCSDDADDALVEGTVEVQATGFSATNDDLEEGTIELQSVGPITFGPDGILFIGDTAAASIYAVDTGDREGSPDSVNLEISDLGSRMASMLGVEARDILIADMAVNPASGKIYFSVSRGAGPDGIPLIVACHPDGSLHELELKDVKHATAEIPNPPAPGIVEQGRRRVNQRAQSITDLQFVDGRLFIAGLSNEEFSSNLRSIPVPFEQASDGTSVEIFHGAHGRFETRSPVRTFTAYEIAGEPHLLCAYTCTPLVKFRVSDLQPGEQLRGTTIAELGNRNRPLDMFVYEQDGQDYILMANSSRGVMKINTEQIGEIDGITDRVSGTAGLEYETIESWQGVEQLDRLSENRAAILIRDEEGLLHLRTVPLP